MNEHYFQKKSKQTLGIIGYLLGIAIFVGAIIAVISDTAQWTTYTMMGCLGLVVFFLSEIVLSSNARTDLLLRIMKRQEELFRQAQKNKAPDIPTDPLEFLKDMMNKKGQKKSSGPDVKGMSISMNDDGMKIEGDEPPQEIIEVLKKITGALRGAIEQELGKNLDKMSVDELQRELDKAIKKEDYKRASVLRDEINKRESDDNE